MENSAFGKSLQADFLAHTCFFLLKRKKEAIKTRKSGFNEKNEVWKTAWENLHGDWTEIP